jgi:RimJ/RimL family protein N-acetyltransferase
LSTTLRYCVGRLNFPGWALGFGMYFAISCHSSFVRSIDLKVCKQRNVRFWDRVYSMRYYRIELLRRSIQRGVRELFKEFFLIARSFVSSKGHEMVFSIDCSEVSACSGFNVQGLRLYNYGLWDEVKPEYREIICNKKNGIWWDAREWLSKGWRLWIGVIDEEPAILAYSYAGDAASNFYFPMTSDCMYIHYVFVMPLYRGRGLLPSMLKHIVYESGRKGFKRVYSIVDKYNSSSISGIKKAGFKQIGCGIINNRTGRRIWYPNSHLNR